MRAIQAGNDAVEKEYTNVGSIISTESGTLDIGKLADPNAVPTPTEPSDPVPLTAQRKVRRPDYIDQQAKYPVCGCVLRC